MVHQGNISISVTTHRFGSVRWIFHKVIFLERLNPDLHRRDPGRLAGTRSGLCEQRPRANDLELRSFARVYARARSHVRRLTDRDVPSAKLLQKNYGSHCAVERFSSHPRHPIDLIGRSDCNECFESAFQASFYTRFYLRNALHHRFQTHSAHHLFRKNCF